MKIKEKYKPNQIPVSWLLEQYKQGQIVIPEIQRPFVWDNERVRKLIESFYRGYPVGYIVTSTTKNIKLKDGKTSSGQTMIIDGQQRITALATALLGKEVVNKDYSRKIVKIAFNPIDESFAVCDAAIMKNKAYIPDISKLFNGSNIELAKSFSEANEGFDPFKCMEIFEKVTDIANRQIGVIELTDGIDMDDVTEIFNRINSQGVPLKEVDFVMSKIAADESHEGNMLCKAIHHFAEMVVDSGMYDVIKKNDDMFSQTEMMKKMSWLRNESDDVYDPKYEDILRVILTFKFGRGKMNDLVHLLSGRNFATRSYEAEIIDDTYMKLKEGLENYVNETNFKNFVMIVSSAGFCRGALIRSMGAMNFCYALYLYLRSIGYRSDEPGHSVSRWLVMSLLTGRYSSGAESKFETDIRNIQKNGIDACLAEAERFGLSDNFWDEQLVKNLAASGMSSAAYNVYLASLCKNNVRGLLSKTLTVEAMIKEKGDVHHIFPKKFLQENGYSQVQYNQIANFAYVETGVNIAIGKKAPNVYFAYVVNEQCMNGALKYGAITDIEDLRKNMAENCIPTGLDEMGVDNYYDFLQERRVLMAKAIKEYYMSL